MARLCRRVQKPDESEEVTMTILREGESLQCDNCGKDLPRPEGEVFRMGWSVCTDCKDDPDVQALLEKRGSIPEHQWLFEVALFFACGRPLGREHDLS